MITSFYDCTKIVVSNEVIPIPFFLHLWVKISFWFYGVSFSYFLSATSLQCFLHVDIEGSISIQGLLKSNHVYICRQDCTLGYIYAKCVVLSNDLICAALNSLIATIITSLQSDPSIGHWYKKKSHGRLIKLFNNSSVCWQATYHDFAWKIQFRNDLK